MTKPTFFSSESVTEGHPDKIADQVSDAILDSIMASDPNARVACETAVTTGMVLVMGEISCDCYVDVPKIVRNTVEDIGYTNAAFGLDFKSCAVLSSIDEQSPDISQGVTESIEIREQGGSEYDQTGAGDQGMMFGFACDETPELMPIPIMLAHKLTKRLTDVRKRGSLAYLRPDGKSQVTVQYDGYKPVRVENVVISTQHDEHVSLETIAEDLKRQVIEPVIPTEFLDDDTKIYINPTGRFVIGGPHGDAGLTGRKIIVDTYGGAAPHGGGAFSGKDPTKVDRSAAYACRYLAKNVVAAGLAEKCTIQLAYAIGVAEPVSFYANTHGTGTIADTYLKDRLAESMNLTPRGIRQHLSLNAPIYAPSAAYGHFGRSAGEAGPGTFSWEATNLVDDLQSAMA